MLGRRPNRGVSKTAETQVAVVADDALPHGLMPSSPPPADQVSDPDEGFPFEIFEADYSAGLPPEEGRWIDPYPERVTKAARLPTDMPVGALRRRGLNRSAK